MRSALALVTTCWGIVMSVAPLLQVRVIRRRRDSTGVSLGWPAVLLVGFVLWLLYGITIRNVPLIVTNIVSTLVCVFTLTMIIRYRRPPKADT
jgi:MtN3 and saliva related transmembrane protein